MAQESIDSEKMVLPLTAGLSICMTGLLLLIGFKIRWFRARITMGVPQEQEQRQSAPMAGTYRRTFDSDTVPPMLQVTPHHRSMPDLTTKTTKQNGILTEPVKGAKHWPMMKTPQENNTSEMQKNTRRQTGRFEPPVEITVQQNKSSLHSEKVHNIPSPMKSKSPMSTNRGQTLEVKDEHFLSVKPKLATPLSSRSSSPMFGEAPLNHRADRLESFYVAPEVGVPFARGNPLPKWAQQDKSLSNNISDSDSLHSETESRDKFTFKDLNKNSEFTKAANTRIQGFHEYEESDT